MKRAYADTPDGQVHYRVAGTGQPIVLMHWAPSSGRQHEQLLPLLAARGFRAFAPDLMGYGDSDKPDRQWSIADHARNLGDFLDTLELPAVFLYGGHTTAAVATEFAIMSPARVKALVLDGSHMIWAWQRSLRHPSMPLDEAFAASIDLLKAGRTYHTGYEAVWAYDMGARLPLLALPVLALTTPADPLADAHQSVLRLVADCREFVAPSIASQSVEERAEMMANVLSRFCDAVAS